MKDKKRVWKIKHILLVLILLTFTIIMSTIVYSAACTVQGEVFYPGQVDVPAGIFVNITYNDTVQGDPDPFINTTTSLGFPPLPQFASGGYTWTKHRCPSSH